MYNFLKFSMNKISTLVMDTFKDISCRIVNIHDRISCQTGVRGSILCVGHVPPGHLPPAQKWYVRTFAP